jgi:ABC-type uncharacterized transport system auxiliary subunit
MSEPRSTGPRAPAGTSAALLASALMLAACAQPPVPDDHYYRLQADPPAASFREPPLKGVLELDEIVAEGQVGGRAILYAEAQRPHDLKEYHYHHWIEPPKSMLQDQLAAYLRAARAAGQVVSRRMRVDRDYELAGKLVRLERIDGAPTKVTIELELGLKRTKDTKLLLLNVYRADVEARADGMADAVHAFNKALSGILARLVQDIGAL